MASQDLLVYRSYNYGGVNVVVKIDFLEHTAGIVEKNRGGDFVPKKWQFTDRPVEYMNGWRLIFMAMDYAIIEAKKELEAVKKKEFDKFVDIMVSLDKVKEEDLENGKKNNSSSKPRRTGAK